VLVFDSSLEHQHSTLRNFARRWFGPYVEIAIYDNATYFVCQLDGMRLKIPMAGKRVKTFRLRDSMFTPYDLTCFQNFDFDEVEDVEACKKDEDI
jgi:hypothetical protein